MSGERVPRKPSWFVLRFTIREFLGVVAAMCIGGWILRATVQAYQDNARVDRGPCLDLPIFFLRRLRGVGPPVRGIAEILDWHARWDPYGVLALAVTAMLLVVAVARRAARRGGSRRLMAALLAGCLLAAALVGWVAGRNRDTLRGYARWAASCEKNDRVSITRMSPAEAEYRGRRAAEDLARHCSYRERYEAMAALPWYRLILPLERAPLVPWQFMEWPPVPAK